MKEIEAKKKVTYHLHAATLADLSKLVHAWRCSKTAAITRAVQEAAERLKESRAK